MTNIQITDFLNGLQLGEKGRTGSLRHIAYVIGETEYNLVKNAPKEQVVSVLAKYYTAPNRFNILWGNLNEAERKVVSLHIWGKGSELEVYADEVAKEFGISAKFTNMFYSYSWNGLEKFKQKYSDQKSPLWLLFPNRYSQIFNDELREAVGEMKRVYVNVSNKTSLLSRENRAADFASIVRF